MQLETDCRYVWGADAIGQATGQSRHAVYHKFAKGHLPGAIKLGGTLVLDLEEFRAAFREGGPDAGAAS